MKIQKFTLGLFLFSSFAYSMAENVIVYRWVDSNNVVHFSQHQPKHDNYTEISMSNTVKAKTETKDDITENKPETPIKIAATPNKCDEAKANVETLKGFDKIQYTNAKGELQVLSDQEKVQQLAVNEKQVEVYCGTN
ncbi:DUF4124 domain-containing protein [Colwellia sp. 1_MG-2023]|uniref:DUF4124 domain-containing protein n=1 Tax=Colwellia sp. 1_MG-2023 TaxID=3062649 RepID=UPI0026E354ED|nr:DUF4124 domain-containing protein [Colwellia sp. 1_MG-2023]MDO6446199.1 DUF4124 domain-containing protein [Colwellia sp. 1_MG-2023]